jgi:hypothetical protein
LHVARRLASPTQKGGKAEGKCRKNVSSENCSLGNAASLLRFTFIVKLKKVKIIRELEQVCNLKGERQRDLHALGSDTKTLKMGINT